ncbi:MAG TPA: DUF6602 domain-containing protein [Bacteroidia bacterium]|jgi:hypothetical protein|nr:DUF6602 domain-containing protein [Bacteroidia bacterium]
MHEKVSIKDLFTGFQDEMKAKLNTIRQNVKHPGTKGEGSENNWIEWLRVHLPNRYKIDKAFIIDCDGDLSQQIDLVVYDGQYSPFVFNKSGLIYIPAESVYAIFEVKQELSREQIIYAAKKAESVRTLKRTSVPITHAGGVFKEPKPPFKILAGIITTESSWSPALGDAFETVMKELNEQQSLELGCSMHGSFLSKTENGQLMFSKSTENEALLFFFLNLFMELQKLGTVPAMDIVQYAKALDSI